MKLQNKIDFNFNLRKVNDILANADEHCRISAT